MSRWAEVGGWLKDNAGTGAALVGSLLTGNVPSAVALGVSLVSSATGSDDPAAALQSLRQDPTTVVRLRELAIQESADIRQHIRAMHELDLQDKQAEHSETQKTIRAGDSNLDKVVRMVRPDMAKQSWKATIAYCLCCMVVKAFGTDIWSSELAAIIAGPAYGYLGLRQLGKGIDAFVTKQANA